MKYAEYLEELANRIDNIVEKAKEADYKSERSRRKDVIAAVKRETKIICDCMTDNIERRLLYNHCLAFANSLLNEMTEDEFYYYITILVEEIRTQANVEKEKHTTHAIEEVQNNTETKQEINIENKQHTETRKISSGLVPFRN